VKLCTLAARVFRSQHYKMALDKYENGAHAMKCHPIS